ncbi:hypothetical protein AOC36_01370 [Erysipelothrix larvae]|uniref:Glycosyl transferase family 1 domain-containing protein n=1 Tax=Erysipelothrix larvae TaxID=1514105 RepID=A0A109UGI2_9FIRM|nr:glycosyltransferase family 4 protein [Erysipelothrix larvae]AMC92686.1 hypothetical protein AOC36_01370 [Erysipelothrix larvae]
MKVVILGVPKKVSSGVRTHVESLKHGLNAYNVETNMISSYPEGIYRCIVSLPHKILGFINKDLAFKWRYITREIYVKKALKEAVENGSDIIINIESVDWYGTVKQYLNNKNITVVLTVHSIYSEQIRAKGYSSSSISKIKEIEIEAYRNIEKVVAVSTFIEKYIKDQSNRNDIAMISNGLILDDIPVKKIEKQQDSILKCMFIGSLLKYKGVHIALEAIRILIDNDINVYFDIIGDGPEFNNLNTIVKDLGIEDNVKFLGVIPRNQANKKMIEYDIALVPSIPYGDNGEESFSYSCGEAMAAGLVVIASSIGGLTNIIQNGVNGYLVNYGDANEIAKVIMDNLSTIKEDETLRANARSTIEHRYSSESMAKKYIELFTR